MTVLLNRYSNKITCTFISFRYHTHSNISNHRYFNEMAGFTQDEVDCHLETIVCSRVWVKSQQGALKNLPTRSLYILVLIFSSVLVTYCIHI